MRSVRTWFMSHMQVWLAALCMQWYVLGSTFHRPLVKLIVICMIRKKVIGNMLNGSRKTFWDFFFFLIVNTSELSLIEG